MPVMCMCVGFGIISKKIIWLALLDAFNSNSEFLSAYFQFSLLLYGMYFLLVAFIFVCWCVRVSIEPHLCFFFLKNSPPGICVILYVILNISKKNLIKLFHRSPQTICVFPFFSFSHNLYDKAYCKKKSCINIFLFLFLKTNLRYAVVNLQNTVRPIRIKMFRSMYL